MNTPRHTPNACTLGSPRANGTRPHNREAWEDYPNGSIAKGGIVPPKTSSNKDFLLHESGKMPCYPQHHESRFDRMTMNMNRLPTSDEEVKSLLLLSVAAGFGALARILYGKDELSWRYTAGSIFAAMGSAMIVYGSLLSTLDQSKALSGYIAVALGCACGLFLDDVMRRIHKKMFNGTPEDNRLNPPSPPNP